MTRVAVRQMDTKPHMLKCDVLEWRKCDAELNSDLIGGARKEPMVTGRFA